MRLETNFYNKIAKLFTKMKSKLRSRKRKITDNNELRDIEELKKLMAITLLNKNIKPNKNKTFKNRFIIFEYSLHTAKNINFNLGDFIQSIATSNAIKSVYGGGYKGNYIL